MSRFQPVPEPAYTDGRASQTLLRHANGCLRSAYLYLRYRGEASTPEMQRGSALHAVIERSIRLCVEQGEVAVPPEIVKVIVDEALREFHVPIEHHDYLREMSYRWASETAVGRPLAVETLFEIDVDGFKVRCRIDYAEAVETGVVAVKDWKSSRAAPSYEEISRKRHDGTLAAKSFQLVLYALALRYGVPVREETCPNCGGNPLREHPNPGGDRDVEECDVCEGTGVLETPEPFPLPEGAGAYEMRLEFVYPGIVDRFTERMMTRPVTLTATECDEYMGSLRALVARVREAEESRDWPAVASDAACAECPAESECPIPRELRDHRGTINTLAEASEALEVVDRRSAIDAAIRREVKAFAKATGHEIPVGSDRVARFVSTAQERIPDKDAMFAAMERAVRYGEPFDRDLFVKQVNGTSFKVEKIAEGSDEQ